MAEPVKQSVAATESGLWKRVAPLIVLTAEVSGLVTFVGAFFSVIFNTLAFRAMGLNFVEIATPASGLPRLRRGQTPRLPANQSFFG